MRISASVPGTIFSKMSHPRCMYINNRCRCQSIIQQYLKRCLIKNDSNYMFRPIAAIVRFSSESMLVVLYRIGMAMSRWWDLTETCSYHHPLLNIFLDIVVLLTDTYTYCWPTWCHALFYFTHMCSMFYCLIGNALLIYYVIVNLRSEVCAISNSQ